MLLDARRFDGVIFAGENSGGSIDYTNVCVTSVGKGPFRHHLGFPTFARSKDAMVNPMNPTGIGVDIQLDPDGDMLGQMLELLETATSLSKSHKRL